jgi:predicted ATPase
MLDEALAAVYATGERWWEAELHRLRGELLLMQAVESGGALCAAPARSPLAMATGEGTSPRTLQADAETWFRQALDIARRQGAKSLELRAVLSLSQLWQRQGRSEEARQLLAESYGWFTEGFDTADLQVPKALLAALQASVPSTRRGPRQRGPARSVKRQEPG